MAYDKTVQTKHVDTVSVLTIIEWMSTVQHCEVTLQLLQGIYEPEFPPKVIQAKLKNLLDKAYVDGCACGCRGSFSLTHHGVDLLKKELEKMDSQE